MAKSRKKILIVNCYFDAERISIKRKFKIPQAMTPAFLAGMFSRKNCDIKLYNEQYSGHLRDLKLVEWPDMVVLTGLNTAFDRMLHISAYVRSNNSKAVVVAGGSAIRALPKYSKPFFDYCCTGDIEQLEHVIKEEFGVDFVSEEFLEKSWTTPRYDLVYWSGMVGYIESTRNCYFRCGFCSISAENNKFISNSIDNIDSQLNAVGNNRILAFVDNNFCHQDSDFTGKRYELLKAHWQEGRFKNWSAEVSSDFFTENNLVNAKESGCGLLFCGVESFNDGALKNINKKHHTDHSLEDVIEKCINTGILFFYGLVVDLTTRNIEAVKSELDYIFSNPNITLPSYISVAAPIIGTSYFKKCLNRKLIFPNTRLRDIDGATLNLQPKDSLGSALQFLGEIQRIKNYRLKGLRHSIKFFQRHRKTLTGFLSAVAFNNLMMLSIPNVTSAFTDVPSWTRPIWSRKKRSFAGYLESVDSAYTPVFKVDQAYRGYFNPTLVTDSNGELNEELKADLGPRESEKN